MKLLLVFLFTLYSTLSHSFVEREPTWLQSKSLKKSLAETTNYSNDILEFIRFDFGEVNRFCPPEKADQQAAAATAATLLAIKKSSPTCIELIRPFFKKINPIHPYRELLRDLKASPGAKDYLKKYLLLFPATATAEVKSIVESYQELEKKMKDVPLSTFDGTVWRGQERIHYDGKRPEVDFVYESGANYVSRNKPLNHRYTMPGEAALYTALGKKKDAIETIFLEYRGDVPKKNMIFQSKKYKLGRVLDLTNSKVLRHLGVPKLMDTTIKKEINPKAYFLTHQLGHIAKRHGIKAIKAKSAQHEGKDNLVIFKLND